MLLNSTLSCKLGVHVVTLYIMKSLCVVDEDDYICFDPGHLLGR